MRYIYIVTHEGLGVHGRAQRATIIRSFPSIRSLISITGVNNLRTDFFIFNRKGDKCKYFKRK